jgi:hypothetical protein
MVATLEAATDRVSGGWKVSHFRGQGEPPPSRQSEQAFRHKPPQHQAMGVCGEKPAGEQGGSILAAIMAHFLPRSTWTGLFYSIVPATPPRRTVILCLPGQLRGCHPLSQRRGWPNGHAKYLQFAYFSTPDLSKAWLKVPHKKTDVDGAILVCRSWRYQNYELDYRFLKHDKRVYYVGSPEEYETFAARVPVPHYETRDFRQLAQAIKRATQGRINAPGRSKGQENDRSRRADGTAQELYRGPGGSRR